MSDSSTAQKGPGMAIAALVLGIVAAITALIPVVGFFLIWVPAILGIVFGIIGMTGGRPKRGIALAGGILSVVSVIIAIATFAVGVAAGAGAVQSALEDASTEISASAEAATGGSASAGSTNGDTTVVYEVTGDGGASTISYGTYDSGSFSSASVTDPALPWSMTQTIAGGGSAFDLNTLNVNAMSGANSTTISCKITVNGEVVSEETSNGAFAMVMCMKVQ